MRACIYGAGAMGTVLGAFISQRGMQVDLVTRNAQHVAALNGGGAKIIYPDGGGFTCAVRALVPENMSGAYDVIFLMTKQREERKIAAFLRDFLAPGGVVCTTQNGLPEYSLAPVLGEENVLGCAVSWGATFVQPGCVMLTSARDAMTFSLGSPFGNGQKIPLAKPYLECAGRVETIENFLGARWSKLIVNSAFSSLSAVTSLTFGQLAKQKSSRRLVQMLLKEGIDTALACGVTPAKIQGHDLVKWLNYSGAIKKRLSFALIPIAIKKHKNLVSGMYYDLAAGKKCDIDFVSGAVAERAAAAGAEVPLTRAVIALAHEIECKKLKPLPENIALLWSRLKG